jgi:hypothetical protein
MTKRIAILALFLFVAAPSFAQKIYIDYDKEADFDSYKTYSWAKTEETSVKDESPLMHSRMVNAIEYYLNKGGGVEVEENPDLYVTYHTNSKEEVQLSTSYYGYGYGGGWYRDPYWGGGYGMGGSSTTAYTYTRGTLIIDIWDAKEKKMVWRGAAEAIVKEKPEKQAAQIDKALAKMVSKWQNMKAKVEKDEAKAAKQKAKEEAKAAG